jgi:K+-sensing histidine kinase KdpD
VTQKLESFQADCSRPRAGSAFPLKVLTQEPFAVGEGEGELASARPVDPTDAGMDLGSGVFQVQKSQSVDTYALHDAKNLLGAIFANIDWLRQSCESEGKPESLEAISDLTQACRQLESLLVEGLVARQVPIGALRLRKQRTSLSELVAAAVRRVDKRARMAGLEIVVAGSPSLHASLDPELVARVVDNLLDNAVRVSPSGSRISVHYGDSGGDVVLTVADQGPGIPEEERAQIFELFAASPTRPGHRGTAGMGLAFCQKVVEAHGGRVILDDRSTGACFVVTFPMFG